MQQDRERNQWGKCTSATDVVCATAYRYMGKKHAIIEAGIEAWLCWKIRRTNARHSKYITPALLIIMLCLFQIQVVWMSTAVCIKMSFTAVCTSSLTHFVLVSWPQIRYLVTANREKSCKDSVSLRCNKNNTHSLMTVLFCFLAVLLTASHVLYRVVKSPLMCRKQFNLYQRRRQRAIFWALHFYSSLHIKPGWQQLAGMDCCASVRFQQWYCLLKPLSTSLSMFMSTGLGATCFSQNAQISEEYVRGVPLTCRTGVSSCSATHVGRMESDLFVSPQTVRPSSPLAWGTARLSAAG